MHWLVTIVLVLAPLYVWRFTIFGLPTNFLMIASFVVIGWFAVSILARRQVGESVAMLKSIPKPVAVLGGLFFVASIISLFVGGVTIEKIGQWLVLYMQPLLIALGVYVYAQRYPVSRDTVVNGLLVFVAACGLLALAQYVTLWTLPEAWWGNSAEPKRAIAFWAHPNGFGLFVTPVLAWLLPQVVGRLKNKVDWTSLFVSLAWLLGALGIFISLSRGAWIGLLAATGIYVLVNANKKMILGFAGVVIILAGIVAVTPNLRYRVLLPFQGEKSAVARLSLWDTAGKMITNSPILGKGVHGFNYNWDTYNTDPNLDHYNFPHNIVLNFWTDTGLLGLLSMLGLLAWMVWQGMWNRRNTFAFGFALFVVAMCLHGLIDIPYFKNDLALVFWTLLAVSIPNKTQAP